MTSQDCPLFPSVSLSEEPLLEADFSNSSTTTPCSFNTKDTLNIYVGTIHISSAFIPKTSKILFPPPPFQQLGAGLETKNWLGCVLGMSIAGANSKEIFSMQVFFCNGAISVSL